jgi:thioesterase domain-containing protein
LIFVPSFITGDPHEYARLAQQFRGERRVLSFPLPGFVEGEAVPADATAAARAQAAGIARLEIEHGFVLLGHSTGGCLALATASELEAAGTPVAAVVLVDTFFQASGKFLEFTPESAAAFWTGEGPFRIDDASMTATRLYAQSFAAWMPAKIETPIVAVRASEPPPGLKAERQADWRESWPPTDAGTEVPGDHFSMMTEHVETTAQAIREELGLRRNGDEKKAKRGSNAAEHK